MEKRSLALLALVFFLTSYPVSADDVASAVQMQSLFRGNKARKRYREELEMNRVAENVWRQDLYQVPDPIAGDGLSNIIGPEFPEAFIFPDALQGMILQYVTSPSERCVLSPHAILPPNASYKQKQEFKKLQRAYQLEKINQHLPQFIELPEVTAHDVALLAQANVQTSIRVMPGFKAANVKNSIGLYAAVMGTYPDLSEVDWLTDQQRVTQYAAWKANPDLPLTHTTSAQDVAFSNRLSQLTGRKFVIMSEQQNEVMRRGRTEDTEDFSQGSLTITKYHFGDNHAEVKERAFIVGNPLNQDQAHGVHEIPGDAPDGAYKNRRGFIHPIGNVYERSPDGVIRGGSFCYDGWSAKSSSRKVGYAGSRVKNIGSRLAEIL